MEAALDPALDRTKARTSRPLRLSGRGALHSELRCRGYELPQLYVADDADVAAIASAYGHRALDGSGDRCLPSRYAMSLAPTVSRNDFPVAIAVVVAFDLAQTRPEDARFSKAGARRTVRVSGDSNLRQPMVTRLVRALEVLAQQVPFENSLSSRSCRHGRLEAHTGSPTTSILSLATRRGPDHGGGRSREQGTIEVQGRLHRSG